jgi:hypothetical protein
MTIFFPYPHNVTGVRLAIGTDQQDKLIRNVDARQDFDGGTERRHISDCATDLRICKDDLTGLKTPNRGSAFVHGAWTEALQSFVRTTSATDAEIL